MKHFQQTLLSWYEANKRDLPWRQTNDPYRIWVSEIILQQTRVEQGKDYYLRFINRFPDVSSLAAAPSDEVMRYWQGLGYYSRARNMHQAAQGMNGTFPSSYQEVRALRGVGDYTAAAICSLAYDMPYAVVDGNVYRVLSRYFGIDTPIDSTEGKKYFATLAQEMLDKSHPAAYNQAIMDFGAIQCTPQSPQCLLCPLADTCTALREGKVAQLPVKQHKTQVTHRYFNYIFILQENHTYIYKRNASDIWRGLYELPLIESGHELPEDQLLTHPTLRQWLGNVPLTILNVEQGIRHVLTHRVIHANFYQVRIPKDYAICASFMRISLQDLHDYAFPVLITRYLQRIL